MKPDRPRPYASMVGIGPVRVGASAQCPSWIFRIEIEVVEGKQRRLKLVVLAPLMVLKNQDVSGTAGGGKRGSNTVCCRFGSREI